MKEAHKQALIDARIDAVERYEISSHTLESFIAQLKKERNPHIGSDFNEFMKEVE